MFRIAASSVLVNSISECLQEAAEEVNIEQLSPFEAHLEGFTE